MLAAIAALGDENAAMTQMARGAVKLTLDLYRTGQVHGVLALGGTMGTDLALDVMAALPLGMPKLIVTTVAYSHLIAPERLAPDLMMILWAGGLYGLNTICQSILSQAAGAVLGACSTVVVSVPNQPRVAIGSLGKSCLSYMVRLTEGLTARGYEPVVFHCTGIGGRAMETLIEQDQFVAVFDFALGEVTGRKRHDRCTKLVATATPVRSAPLSRTQSIDWVCHHDRGRASRTGAHDCGQVGHLQRTDRAATTASRCARVGPPRPAIACPAGPRRLHGRVQGLCSRSN